MRLAGAGPRVELRLSPARPTAADVTVERRSIDAWGGPVAVEQGTAVVALPVWR
jgi:hypothetical protein